MRELNNDLLELKKYVNYSLESIMHFLAISEKCGKYDEFRKVVYLHNENLENIRDILKSVYEFQPSLSKITHIGYMQQCLYEIHSNVEYAEALSWSFGFEGYMNNLRGVHENLKNKKLNYTKYDGSRKLYIEQQKYVPIEYPSKHREKEAIGNNCDLEKNILMTGPNASGKTTFLKTTLLNVLFSQQIGCGYFKHCRMNPYVYIHSYLNIPDTSERDSLFQAESRRCKQILDCLSNNAQERHLCVFDELYSGTNPEEATKSSYAFLKYLTRYDHLDFILTTHYLKVCKKLKKNAKIQCCKMDAVVHPDQEIEYTYKMKKGISKIQGAYCVLKNMDYPNEILNYYHEICSKNAKKI
jgi:dsDNA-specific endonuclease/ATPase MutS2